MKIRSTALVSSIALSFAATAHAQSVLRSIPGSPIGGAFGRTIERYADLDGDGLPELLVGAPNPGGFGRVSVISSKYIANGTGSPVLWSVQGTQLGSTFGAAIVNLGDVTGDGVADFAVGAPLQPPGTTLPEVDIVSGASHSIVGVATVIAIVSQIGASLAPLGDVDGDGVADFAVGCTSFSTGAASGSGFFVASTKVILSGGNFWELVSGINGASSDQEGASISTGDINGDGKLDLVTGAPGANGGSGEIRIYLAPSFTLWKSIAGTGGERLGASVDASRDLDGDGKLDILAGGPNAASNGFQRGEAIVFSGARLIANAPPFDVRHWTGNTDSEHFGAAVSTTFDLNGDFAADAIVGAPDWTSTFSPGAGRVAFFSGATGENFGTLFGQPGDGIGDGLSDAGAYDGTFYSDVAIGGSTSDVGGSNAASFESRSSSRLFRRPTARRR